MNNPKQVGRILYDPIDQWWTIEFPNGNAVSGGDLEDCAKRAAEMALREAIKRWGEPR